MEPESSAPQVNPEQAPVSYDQRIERAPQPFSPESGIESGAERFEQTSEARAAVSDSSFVGVLPPPIVDATAPVATAQPAPVSSPMTANDDDLIEKEWVDKAKKIIAETKDDPYRREEAVNQLQREYLKKRYGRELGQTV